MADRTFEAQLERAFADAPAFPDADLFTAKIMGALDRGWLFRRLLIGALGVAGGVIGGAQVLHAGLLGHVGSVSQAWRLVANGAANLPAARDVFALIGSGATMDSEVLWMSGAMAILAVGLFVTRSIRDF